MTVLGPTQEDIVHDLDRLAGELKALTTITRNLQARVAALIVSRLAPDDLLTVSEIAALFGVQPHTVSTWRERNRLPEPWAVKPSGPIWLRSQIEAVRLERGLPAWPETQVDFTEEG